MVILVTNRFMGLYLGNGPKYVAKFYTTRKFFFFSEIFDWKYIIQSCIRILYIDYCQIFLLNSSFSLVKRYIEGFVRIGERDRRCNWCNSKMTRILYGVRPSSIICRSRFQPRKYTIQVILGACDLASCYKLGNLTPAGRRETISWGRMESVDRRI